MVFVQLIKIALVSEEKLVQPVKLTVDVIAMEYVELITLVSVI
jgi:hypothetical protein